MTLEQYYELRYQIFCWAPYMGWVFVLWFNLSKGVEGWRSRVSWRLVGSLFLAFVGLLLIRWDHDMLFYRTYWFEYIRLITVLAVTGSVYTRLALQLTAFSTNTWLKRVIVIVLFIFLFVPLFFLIFAASTPCA